MNQHHRVLGREGARELTTSEVEVVTGAIGTKTLCTAPSPSQPKGDGDASIGEC